MPSVFVSYAHEDQEFALALIEELQMGNVDVRYDQVVLHVGDSLIEKLSTEILEGDFLVAIVSPDSVGSAWCRKELSLAQTHGINEKRVKVLPVRYRSPAMPPALTDTYWSDADAFDVPKVAEMLRNAISTHREGRPLDQKPRSEPLVRSSGVRTDMATINETILQIDEIASGVWDVIKEWERSRKFGGGTVELDDRKRRLRWILDSVSESIRAALPSVVRLSEAGWNEFYRLTEPPSAERGLREELRSVKNQIAQDLPLGRRWMTGRELGEIDAGNRDAVAYQWDITRGEETRRIKVFISGTAMASHNETLPQEVVDAKTTQGRSVVATLVALDQPPLEVMVTTVGTSWPLPD